MNGYTIGIDYGTNSVRTVVVDCSDGAEVGTSVFSYPTGDQGIILDPADHNLARQNPADYIEGIARSVRGALEQAARQADFSPEYVIGIGVDTTGSTLSPMERQPGGTRLAVERSHGCRRSRADNGYGAGASSAVSR